MKTVYIITAFQTISRFQVKNLSYPDFGERWCVGWYEDFLEAETAVVNNWGNLHNDMYEYAIIEEMEPGICMSDRNRFLYKWNSACDQYERIEDDKIPQEVKTCSNFGIG